MSNVGGLMHARGRHHMGMTETRWKWTMLLAGIDSSRELPVLFISRDAPNGILSRRDVLRL